MTRWREIQCNNTHTQKSRKKGKRNGNAIKEKKIKRSNQWVCVPGSDWHMKKELPDPAGTALSPRYSQESPWVQALEYGWTPN